jgi:heat-inducible transcriptional repressor
MNMDNRKKKIFKTLVQEHIRTGLPVGSNFLLAKIGMDISSATVRNEFAELAELGLLSQPHTSAGRVPSEEGWKFFTENLMDPQELDEKEKASFAEIKKNFKGGEMYKALAKKIAEISGETAIIAFGANDIYYTGFSNLFSKPELAGYDFNMGTIIDEMNDAMREAYQNISIEKPAILLGAKNPFNPSCASIFSKIDNNLVVILGLLRMDYGKNISILNFVQELLGE